MKILLPTTYELLSKRHSGKYGLDLFKILAIKNIFVKTIIYIIICTYYNSTYMNFHKWNENYNQHPDKKNTTKPQKPCGMFLFSHYSYSPPPSRITTVLTSNNIDQSCLFLYKGNNTICSLLCLASLLNIMFLRFIHIAVLVINYSFIFLHRISLCDCITIYVSILLLMGIWNIFILGLLSRVLL